MQSIVLTKRMGHRNNGPHVRTDRTNKFVLESCVRGDLGLAVFTKYLD